MRLKVNALCLFFLVISSTVSAQWEIKHIWENSLSFHNVIKFKNDSVGLQMGYLQAPLAGYPFLILKTEDAGETWRDIFLDVNAHARDLQFVSDSLVYAVGGDSRFGSVMAGKFIYSYDLGETWDSTINTSNDELFSLSFYDPDTGLIAGEEGIFRTVDSGKTWLPVWNVGDLNYNSGRVLKLSLHGQTGYAIAEGRNPNNPFTGFDRFILKTTDQGMTWDTIKSFHEELTALYFLNPDTGFVGVAGNHKLLHKTTDGGLTWTESNLELPVFRVNSIHFPSHHTGYAVGEPIAYLPERGSSFFISKTTDGGENWETFDTLGLPLYSVHFTSDTVGYVSGGKQLIMKTTGEINTLPENYPWWLVDVFVQNLQNDVPKTKVYPNPTNGILHIEALNLDRIESAQVISATGEIVKTVRNPAGEGPLQINISQQPSGLYFIKIAYADRGETLKVIKR